MLNPKMTAKMLLPLQLQDLALNLLPLVHDIVISDGGKENGSGKDSGKGGDKRGRVDPIVVPEKVVAYRNKHGPSD